jgi:hypothetical protein
MDATIASLNIVVAQPLRLFLSRSKATRRELVLQRLEWFLEEILSSPGEAGC